VTFFVAPRAKKKADIEKSRHFAIFDRGNTSIFGK